MTSTAIAGNVPSVTCTPSTCAGESAALRRAHRPQRVAWRDAAAMATRCAPLHHDPGVRMCSRRRRCASRRSSPTGTPIAEESDVVVAAVGGTLEGSLSAAGSTSGSRAASWGDPGRDLPPSSTPSGSTYYSAELVLQPERGSHPRTTDVAAFGDVLNPRPARSAWTEWFPSRLSEWYDAGRWPGGRSRSCSPTW